MRQINRKNCLLSAALALVLAPLPAIAQGPETTSGTQERETASGMQEPETASDTQEPETASDTKDLRVAKIVVTGSRIQNPGYQAPTPVTAVGAQELLTTTPSTVADALRQLPSLTGQSALGGRSYCCAAGTASAGAYLELRQLGPNRTLVLLNSNRLAPSISSGVVDANVLPELLLQRVDVVTGGASAAYGSDAVAGVVNYITDTEFEGLRANLQYGISGYSDDEQIKAGIAGGTSVLDGRGHIIFSLEHYEAAGIPSLLDRPQSAQMWVLAGAGTLASPYYDVADTRFYTGTTGGLIVSSNGLPFNFGSAPLAGTQFLPGGAYGPTNLGTILPPGAPNAVGGDGYSPSGAMQPLGETETNRLYGRFGYDFSPTLHGYVQLTGALNSAQNQYGWPAFSGNSGTLLEMFSGNPFMPAGLQSTMTTNGYTSFFMTRSNREGGASYNTTDTTYYDISGGLSGELVGDWTWDAYLGYGETKQEGAEHNAVNVARLLAAADAVDNGSGSTVCRVTLTSPGSIYDGCVPINLFGFGAPSQAALDYITGTNENSTTSAQQVLALNFQGTLFELPAGPVSVATGVEWRNRELSGTSNLVATSQIDPATIRGRSMNVTLCPTPTACRYGGWIQGNVGEQEQVSDTVQELYFETIAPITTNLELNGALRYTDYSNSGEVSTWKVGVSYEPISDIRFRASRSRDIRAPNLFELFASPSTGFAAFTVNPFTGNQIPTIPTITAGNPDLQPEIGDTSTVGAVFRPSFLPGLSASIDYYNIELTDGIVTARTVPRVLTDCNNGDATACAQIVGDPSVDNITSVSLLQTNASVQNRSGVDFDVSYTRPVGNADVTFRLLAGYIDEADSVSGGVTTELVGLSVPGMPEWRGLLSATYDQGPFSLTVQERYIGSMLKVSPAGGGVFRDPTVPEIFYTNLSAAYAFEAQGGNMQLYATVNNLFDQEPPLMPTTLSGVGYPTIPGLYDLNGRYFTVGIRAEW
ncbi:MAG TPA: TonB-dependent receptor [Hyphomonas sp.]|nr:TonB-dependent receptor [Hyphomonas sp.]